ncbi:Dicamba O-demethylase 1, ferredoxin reductase component [Baekduia alba]|uniref:NAD(P)/FAD-dependent oxidoreductase n=1 Tax=Baekduia alba TaxID=2997333 RepID=UPI0023414393|nr:FAD-dependent oxidoreductase [Baekduia alba]WCB92562.1 Dicamba O-demethylase 1, ferredoxin reductase component [Baekduia alba]
MADRSVDHLLIGGGIAAATCAQTLREEGATGSILLVARELDPPYHRPPITKGYLGGTETKEEGLIDLPEDVEVLTRTSVMALDLATKTVTLSNKETVAYGTALLATGAMVRRLQIDGVHLDGIHYLRAHGNADSLIEDAEAVTDVVCVGGSYIGCESAATLTTLGKQVTVVLLEEEPMERAFGLQVGAWVRGVLAGHGIQVVSDVEVERFEGEGDRVQRVVLAGGRSIDAELVVAGVGVTPDVMLARKSGLEIGERGGVRADAQLRAHGADGLYVAGDIAEYDSPVHGGAIVRVEHEEHAAAQGRTVARNMLGAAVDHTEVPYFFSDLADWASFEYVGPALAWDEEVLEGDMAEGEFTVWYVADGKVAAMLSAGGHGDIDRGKELIATGGAPPTNN